MKTVELIIDRNEKFSNTIDKIVLRAVVKNLLYKDDLEVIHITTSSIMLILQMMHAAALYDFELVVVEDNIRYPTNEYGVFGKKRPLIYKEYENTIFTHLEDNIYKRKMNNSERKTIK